MDSIGGRGFIQGSGKAGKIKRLRQTAKIGQSAGIEKSDMIRLSDRAFAKKDYAIKYGVFPDVKPPTNEPFEPQYIAYGCFPDIKPPVDISVKYGIFPDIKPKIPIDREMLLMYGMFPRDEFPTISIWPDRHPGRLPVMYGIFPEIPDNRDPIPRPGPVNFPLWPNMPAPSWPPIWPGSIGTMPGWPYIPPVDYLPPFYPHIPIPDRPIYPKPWPGHNPNPSIKYGIFPDKPQKFPKKPGKIYDILPHYPKPFEPRAMMYGCFITSLTEGRCS